jgi:predicted Zn-dependent peptidase
MIQEINNGINEILYSTILENGLEVVVHPKKGFHSKYALFATKYGSIDSDFIGLDGKRHKVPEGIAHFLEHKVFDMPDMDVFEEFSKIGASANAYTNYFLTAYLFSCTKNFEKALDLLLDYVQTPYFYDESTEKEKGIIEQEIKMYDDNPEWRVQINLLKSLYHNHPIKDDIAGTVESIYDITTEELLTCYTTFYHPSNMVLYLVGDIDVDETIAFVESNQKKKEFIDGREIEKFYPDEPSTIVKEKHVEKMSVSMPIITIGFKHKLPEDTKELLINEISLRIALDNIIGKSSNLYQEIYEMNLILDDFSYGSSINKDYSFTVLGGSSPNPEKLIDYLIPKLKDVVNSGIIKKDIERTRRKYIGQFIMGSDSLGAAANRYISYKVRGMEFAQYFDILNSVDEETINIVLREMMDFDKIAISIVDKRVAL